MQTDNLKLTPEMLLWNKAKVSYCEMEFSAGGDSMNDYDFYFYDKKDKNINNNDTAALKEFFEDEVFKRVEFYVNSDGYYMGEAGKVVITLNEDDKDEPTFEYDKQAQAEYSETFTTTIYVKLTKEELDVVQSKVGNMNGGDGEKNVNYKIDCIVTDKESEIIDSILVTLDDAADSAEYKDSDGEPSDWYNWTTGEEEGDNEGIEITKEGVRVIARRNFTIYRECEY